MNRLLYFLLLILSSSFALLSACDDEAGSIKFDVLLMVDKTVDNAPSTFTFSSQNNGPLDGEYSYLWTFGDGAESDEESPKHTYEQPGEYEINLTLTEASGAKGSGELTVTVMPSVNLEVSNLSFSPMTTFQPGQEGQANWLFRQRSATANAWRFGLYLVPAVDGAPMGIEPTVESLTQDGITRLAIYSEDLTNMMGENETREDSVELAFSIPNELLSGDYYLAVVADDEEQVGEQNRQDNVVFSSVPLRIRGTNDSGADMTICGLSITSFTGIEAGQRPLIPLGEQLTAELCIANLGDRPIIESPYAIYLSADANLDDDDLLLAQGVEQAIGADDRLTLDILLDLPVDTPLGVYRLLGVADPDEQEVEQREDNNLRASPVPFELVEPGDVEGVDLVVTSVNIDRDRVYWGQRLSGTLSLTHRGDVDVSRLFVVRFNGLAVDEGLPPQQLPSININGIEAGTTIELPFDLNISPRIPEGRYRLQIEVDPTNSTNDVNPGNNRRSTPDIITLGGEPSFDPTARSLTLSTNNITAGQELDVTLNVSNLGTDSTGDFSVAFYLSSDPLIGVGDYESELFDIRSLEGQEERAVTFSLPIPLALDQAIGEWYVAARLDPQRNLSGELSTENNVVFSETTLVVSGATGGCAEDGFEDNDTAARAVSLEAGSYPNLGACDSADWFSVDVPANTIIEVKLSAVENEEDELILPELSLGNGSGTLLQTAEQRANELVLLLPSNPQTTRPYFKVNGSGTQLNYNLDIQLYPQDEEGSLVLSELRVMPNIVESGSPVEVKLLMSNLGLSTVEEGEIIIDLIEEPSLEAPSLGRLTIQGEASSWTSLQLSPGSSLSMNGRFELPANMNDGLYYLRAQHSALDTENNRYAWATTALRIDQEQACTSDRFEPNGSPHEPDGISSGAQAVGNGNFEQLYACAGDDDWYRLTLNEGDALTAEINFNRLSGDLDLELYEADGQTLIAQSESLQGLESVTLFRSATTTDYLLRVFLKANEQVNIATEYNMTIDIGPSNTCGDDGFESNGSADEAALLPDGPHDLVVCPGEEDWFRFQIPAGNIVSYTVSVGFDDVELTLFDPNDMVVDSNNRRIYHEALLTGAYRLRVTPSQQERPAPYTLVVSGVSGLDLAANNLQLTSTEGGPGDELYATVEIENRRGDSAQNIPVRFVLSEDLRISSNDPILGEQEIDLLEGASSIELRQRITIPNGVDAGLYSVICEVDPELSLDDFYLSNNVTRASFEVLAACVDDDQRENEGPRTATPLDWDLEVAQYEGVICPLTEDWFIFTVPAGEHSFTLTTAEGDLDLSIYDVSTNMLLEASQTDNNVEEVTVSLSDTTDLYVQIDGFFDARGAYVLSWE